MNINGSIGSLTSIQNTINTSSERISNGRRINSAADDAAGQALTNRFNSQIRAFDQALRNANDGVSFLQTVDANLSNINDGLVQLEELALQASNGILSDSDRASINDQAQQIKDELLRTLETSLFNDKSVFGGEDTNIQIGNEDADTITLNSNNLQQIFVDLEFNELDLSSNNLDSNVVEILSSSPVRSNLRILKLSKNRVDKFQLNWVNTFPLMETVSLDRNNITANITMDQLPFVQKVTVNLKNNFKVRVILNGAFDKCAGDLRVELQLLETDLDEDCFKTKLTDDLKKVNCIEIPNFLVTARVQIVIV